MAVGVISAPNNPAARLKYDLRNATVNQCIGSAPFPAPPRGFLQRFGADIIGTHVNVGLDRTLRRGFAVNSSGFFTVPVAGVYSASFLFDLHDGNTNHIIRAHISMNGNDTDFLEFEVGPAVDAGIQGFTGIYELSENDSLLPGFSYETGNAGLDFEIRTAIFSVSKIS